MYSPEKTEAENDQIAAMLYEINNYMVYVLKEKLGWHTVGETEMSSGGGHVVVRFEYEGRRMVFRVPRYAVEQLKRTMLAYRHLGHLGVMPEKIYHDGKCIIESHVDGLPISPQVSNSLLVDLATKLTKMHAMPAQGFGPLDFDFQGAYDDVGAYAQTRSPIVIDRSEDDLSSAQASILGDALAQVEAIPSDLLTAKTYVGHGDLWRNNILVDQDTFKIIDWDRIGAYPIEHDLAFLMDANLSATQRKLFFENYGHVVNFGLLKWFGKRKILRNSLLRLPHKIQRIQEIDLI